MSKKSRFSGIEDVADADVPIYALVLMVSLI